MAKKSVVVTVLFIGLVSIWMGGCQTPEQKVERLIKKLGHKKAKVRANAVEALGRIGEDAVPALIQTLRDQDVEGFVRENAAEALGSIGKDAKDAVPALIQALKDESIGVREDAAYLLGKIGSEDTVPALKQALKDQGWRVRGRVVTALGNIGTPEALKAVEEYQPQQ